MPKRTSAFIIIKTPRKAYNDFVLNLSIKLIRKNMIVKANIPIETNESTTHACNDSLSIKPSYNFNLIIKILYFLIILSSWSNKSLFHQ